MFEIEGIDWLAKACKVELPGLAGSTPNILHVAVEGREMPDFAEMVLRSPLVPNDVVSDSPNAAPPYPRSLERLGAAPPGSEPYILSGPPEGWPAGLRTKGRRRLGLCVLANAIELYNEPRTLAERLMAFNGLVGHDALLYAPAAATPANLAVLAYAGVDLFDDVQCLLAAASGHALSHGGHRGSDEPAERLAQENTRALREELLHVRGRIADGRLREYAEYKSRADPRAVELLRHLDLRHFDAVERFAPVSGPAFKANSKSSLSRPDVERWRRRIAERYARPECADILLLLPCSARKPYSESRSHRAFSEAVALSSVGQRVHEVIVTSPLGLVPRELECAYPAKEYDVPVTGDWDRDEREMVLGLLRGLVGKGHYTAVVAHLGDERAYALEACPGALATSGAPTSQGALAQLSGMLGKAAVDGPKVDWGRRRLADMESLARFQFGGPVQGLLDGCKAVERQGLLVALRGKAQVASVSPGRGLLSLTMLGAEALAASGVHVVEIEDFTPKGSVFAVGVEGADERIRAGDEVVVAHGGDVRAVGVARMPGWEMTHAPEGEAVRVRHRK
jgi:archaeosine synthase